MEKMDPQKTFWGLVIEQGKQYKQTPTFNFHVSRAVLDLENYDKVPVSLRVQVDNGEFVLCNLNENETQVSLDLIFSEGEKVKFFTTGGKGNVHLTGYLMPEDSLSQFDDEEFSDEDVSEDEQVMLNRLNQIKRKNTETVKLAGKDSKKMKTDDKPVEANAKQQKVVDVDPKQLLNKKDNKQLDNQQNNQQNKKKEKSNDKVAMNKLATKGLEMDSDSDVNDDDLSIDEDESVDLNAMMDEDSDLNDDDLESNDDLESDDEDDVDIAKLNKMKNQAAGKPNLQQANNSKQQKQKNGVFENSNFKNKQNQQQKPKNDSFMNQNKQNNKSPQQMNKNQKNTPNQNKNQEKPHQQTPFHHKKGNDFKKNSNKKNQGTPFQSGNKGNKSFGSQNKLNKKFNA